MAYKSIASVSDWYFVSSPIPPQNELIVWHLAAWALTAEGEVIGLVSVPGGGPDDTVMGKTCRLVSVPPLKGVYKQRAELSPDEHTALACGKPMKVSC